jgi:hypothetical protein
VEGEWLNGVPHGICIVENEEGRGIAVFNHGKPDGAPGWIELKDNGERISFEYADENPRGVFRMYNSDKEEFNITSTTEKKLAPGWLNSIFNNKGEKGKFGKLFT